MENLLRASLAPQINFVSLTPISSSSSVGELIFFLLLLLPNMPLHILQFTVFYPFAPLPKWVGTLGDVNPHMAARCFKCFHFMIKFLDLVDLLDFSAI